MNIIKARINQVGSLEIERAGIMKVQECPFASFRRTIDPLFSYQPPCGDSCPLFGEPIPAEPYPENVRVIDLCQQKTLLVDLIDERKRKP